MPVNPFRRPRPRRSALVASAAKMSIGDKKEALRVRHLRQGWQAEAWAYYDAIGEVRYAHTFQANATSRVRVFPAVQLDPKSPPVALDELGTKDFPAEVRAAALDDLARLAGDGYGIPGLLHTQTLNHLVCGEYFIVGLPESSDDDEQWSIRSIDEVVINNDGDYFLRDRPPGFNGYEVPPRPLGSDAYVARIWTQHPRYNAMATCAMRPILESCEELLLASRMIRATLRSRIAGAGVLLVPDELELLGINPTDDDPQANPFFEELTKALVTPLQSEGDASEVVPVTIRGPAEVLKELRHIVLDRPIDEHAMALRQELIKRIATGIDLPAEVLTGVTDLNHWSAWQVDDNTFRHHLEPTTLELVRGLAAGFARPQLLARGYDRDVVRRVVYWYDPTELVTHPDRSADAMKLHELAVLSDDGLLEACGFDPKTDKPSADEFLIRLLSKSRAFPPNVVEALFHKYAPTLEIPADTQEAGYQDGQQVREPGDDNPDDPNGGGQNGPPAPVRPTPKPPTPGTTAAATPPGQVFEQESVRLVEIDRQLRDRLLGACDAAVRRQLEKAGARLRSRVARDATLRAQVASVAQADLAQTLGRPAVIAMGLDPDGLLDGEYDDLHRQFDTWVAQAQRQAVATAAQIVKQRVDDPAPAAARTKLDAQRDDAWQFLTDGLNSRSSALLFNPTLSNDGADDNEEEQQGLSVPAQLVRGSLAIAGGYKTLEAAAGLSSQTFRSVDSTERLGGIGTGPIISDYLVGNGVTVHHWTWSHGGTDRPFDPHVQLSGVQFASFQDDALLNTGDFPDDDYYYPGDHDGCTCDAFAAWSDENPEAFVAPPNAAPAARSVLAAATASEPELTSLVSDLAAAHGGEMAGLDFRLKGLGSLTRKIRSEAVAAGRAPEEVAGTMFDANRYTTVFSAGDYASGAQAELDALREQGYTLRVKNYWTIADNPYQGINVQVVGPAGRFELQFHTPQSLAVKEGEMHALYEEQRVSTDPVEIARLNREMADVAAKISVPDGVGGVH